MHCIFYIYGAYTYSEPVHILQSSSNLNSLGCRGNISGSYRRTGQMSVREEGARITHWPAPQCPPSVFAENQVYILDNWSVTAGLRYDHYKRGQ